MADVFISYKRERRPAARHLEDRCLVRYGYSVCVRPCARAGRRLRGADPARVECGQGCDRAVVRPLGSIRRRAAFGGEPGQSAGQARAGRDRALRAAVVLHFGTEHRSDGGGGLAARPRAGSRSWTTWSGWSGRPPAGRPESAARVRGDVAQPRRRPAARQAALGASGGAEDAGAATASMPSPPFQLSHDYAFWERQWERQGAGSQRGGAAGHCRGRATLLRRSRRGQRIAEIEAEAEQQQQCRGAGAARAAEARPPAEQERVARERAAQDEPLSQGQGGDSDHGRRRRERSRSGLGRSRGPARPSGPATSTPGPRWWWCRRVGS